MEFIGMSDFKKGMQELEKIQKRLDSRCDYLKNQLMRNIWKIGSVEFWEEHSKWLAFIIFKNLSGWYTE